MKTYITLRNDDPRSVSNQDLYKTNFTVSLPETLYFESGSKVSLIAAEIPYTCYNINSNNNQIILSGTTYTVSEGNYSLKQFLDSVNLLLDKKVSFKVDEKTLKTTISILSNYNLSGSLLPLFGFEQSFTGRGDHTSSKPVNILSVSSFTVSIDIAKRSHYYTSKKDTVIGIIPINEATFGDIVQYEAKNYNNYSLSMNTFKNVKVNIRDQNLNDIDLNSMPISITLCIESC